MAKANLHDRRRPEWRMEDHPDRVILRLRDFLLSRSDVDDWRWYIASESLRIGHGAIGRVHPSLR